MLFIISKINITNLLVWEHGLISSAMVAYRSFNDETSASVVVERSVEQFDSIIHNYTQLYAIIHNYT